MILLLIVLPLLFLPATFTGHPRVRYRGMIIFSLLHFSLAVLVYAVGSDPFPVFDSHFAWSGVGSAFMLAYTGLQLVSFLSLPRVQATQRHLLGALVLSVLVMASIAATTVETFLPPFVLSLFIPTLWAVMEVGEAQNIMLFLALGIACGICTLVGSMQSSSNQGLELNFWILAAASLRLGLVPFHLWVRRMVRALPLQWTVLYFLSYPSVALLLRTRGADSEPVVDTLFLSLACITTIYGAWVALVENRLRTTFYFLILSFFGAIGMGLAVSSSAHVLSGVLLFWFSASLAVAGFGLTIEILESRFGRLSMEGARGLINNVPTLSALFLLFGLGSVGFPGLCAFIGEEVMLSGIYHEQGWAILPIVCALSLNGVTIVRWFFALFFGPESVRASGIDLLKRERLAFFLLLAIIVGTGIFPRVMFELGRSTFMHPAHAVEAGESAKF